ncbi:DNA cytosine methyltransferase [Thermofilum pendens]|uniref:DNA (cytosine-5-)-methyltransferase n=1 Tax=Thermofilum pendens (strain DSM 2475 / Hrk 5) TaxID=368408 RepID=A1RX95_THEPD|nr:DNA cytosine methyltransferase [Thermofilum pendens]ABL77825.1 DNA-cytosine methyltransferase [Thermofilum pendens Hrk 5]
MSSELTVLDLFAGAGGFSRGFAEEGFSIVGAVEVDPLAAEAFRLNFPGARVFEEDVREVHSRDILLGLGFRPRVIIGGPPCEAYSRANPRREREPLDRLYKDPVGSLVLHYIRIVGDLEPEVFVMENVPGILDEGLGEVLREEFSRVGYHDVYFNVLVAEHYGTPSHRVRVFISNKRISPPKTGKTITVWDAIGDLPPPDPYYEIPNHEPVTLSAGKAKRVAKLRWGEALVHYRGYGGRVLRNLVRLHPYRVAPTVMGSSRFVHPFENRLLTVREQARLMGFPDTHVFVGSKEAQFNQVGEAVPVPLARAIAREVKKTLL